MMSFVLNDLGDVEFDGDGDIRTTTGIDEKEQSVKLLLSIGTGEWFLDLLYGLDYWAFLGQKWPNVREETHAAFLAALRQDPRIEEVQSLDLEYHSETRRLEVEFVVRMGGDLVTSQMEVRM